MTTDTEGLTESNLFDIVLVWCFHEKIGHWAQLLGLS